MKDRRIVLLGLLLILLVGCKEESVSPDDGTDPPASTMDELVIDPDFTFATSTDVKARFVVVRNGGTPLKGIRFTLYKGDPDGNGDPISSGVSNAEGVLETRFRLASYLSEVFIVTTFGKDVVAVSGSSLDYTLTTSF
ncbi:MAG: hypothetical protein ACE5G2_04825 [Candidatus Krumholzibacteriia bacterium]